MAILKRWAKIYKVSALFKAIFIARNENPTVTACKIAATYDFELSLSSIFTSF